jgi:hypothetical protein
MSWKDDWDDYKLLEARNEFISSAAWWLFAIICLIILSYFIMIDHDLDREKQKAKIATQAAKARVLQRVADGSITLSDSILRDVICGSNPVVMRKETEKKYTHK